MLSWWSGRPADGNRVQGDDSDQEAPETPAPVFAARALRSALFGTPAPPKEDTATEVKKERETVTDRDIRNTHHRTMSPTKPPGILLTPGTATTRRKTVSFGTGTCKKNEITEGGTEKRKNQSTERAESSYKTSRRTTLLRSLESSKDTMAKKTSFERNRGSSQAQPLIDLGLDTENAERKDAMQPNTTNTNMSRTTNQELLQEWMTGEEFDGEMTMDLNEPHSQSGKFWKSEYEKYHEQAKIEMERLLKYKQLAKSYAKKKDAETVVLTEKLKEEQRRVITMEERILKLPKQIVTADFEANEDGSPQVIKELPRQTALALQYKAQADELRSALEKNTGKVSASKLNRIVSSQTEETRSDAHHELKSAQQQLQELASLRRETKDLRQALSSAEKTNLNLQEENAKLIQERLHADLRLEEQGDKLKKRRQVTEEQLQKQIEAYKSLQYDYHTLKEKAKAQRGNAEQLLRRRHEQVVELKKELAAFKRADLAGADPSGPLQKKSLEGDQVVARHKKQTTELEDEFGSRSNEGTDAVQVGHAQSRNKSDLGAKSHSSNSVSHGHDILLPILIQSNSISSKSPGYSRETRVEGPGRSPEARPSHPALSEVVNSASVERFPSEKSESVGYTPLANRFSNMSLDAADLELPSPEPSLSHVTGRVVPERRVQPSPRPSMFNFTTSPSRASMGRPRMSEGSRTRSTLPPDRAAAARARLERKNAEKKRALALGTEKENIHN